MATSNVNEIVMPINVGPLTGFGSLCVHTAKPLKDFSLHCMNGLVPDVVWDLRNAQSRQMSMACLTAFLAVAHRLRQFTGRAPLARVNWEPSLFSFWDDISFLQIVKDHDLFRWPDGHLEGYTQGKTNPHTQILFYHKIAPPQDMDNSVLEEWKRYTRNQVKKDLLLRCAPLFHGHKTAMQLDPEVMGQITNTMAELIINSFLHGDASAFVGLQRTSKRITVAVCDCGNGFYHSLLNKPDDARCAEVKDMLDALILGSLINNSSMGLRRAIDTVTMNNGRVLMASNNAEICWKRTLWHKPLPLKNPNLAKIRAVIGPPISGAASRMNQQEGFCRIRNYGLRGSRIAFELQIGT